MPAFLRQWPGWTRVALAGAAMLLLFLQRPVFVDDHAHYAQALGLAREGSGLYRGSAFAMGWTPGESPGEANPPGYFYLMAGWIKLVGPEIWKAHVLIMLISLGGLLAFYSIAHRYVAHPEWAALLWMSSPHYWLTSNSLLLDALLGPAIVLGLACWIKAWESRRVGYFLAAIFFLTLAPFIKYTGLIAWPLVLLWTVFEGKSIRSPRWLWLLIPTFVFVGWCGWSKHLYGQAHFAAVAHAKMTWPTLAHLMTLMLFAMGTTPVLGFGACAWIVHRPRARWAIALILIAAFMTITARLGLRGGQGFALAFGCGGFLVWLLSVLEMWKSNRKAVPILLAWAGLGLLFLLIAIPWVCARYFVIVGPALTLVTLKSIETWRPDWLSSSSWRIATLICLIVLGGFLAQADLAQAQADEQAAHWAEAYRRKYSPTQSAYYAAAHLGGSGFYLEQEGWKGLDNQSTLPENAILFLPRRSLPKKFWPQMGSTELIAEWSARYWNPLRTLDGVSGAGFYGSIWAPLPYAVSFEPIDHYLILKATAPS